MGRPAEPSGPHVARAPSAARRTRGSADLSSGLDGGIVKPRGDFSCPVADASVTDAKLHLVLQKSIEATIDLKIACRAGQPVQINEEGRDPKNSSALMLQGVYGGSLASTPRIPAVLRDVRRRRRAVGRRASKRGDGQERAFGKAFHRPCRAETSSLEFSYDTPRVATAVGKTRHYELYIQKEAGTALGSDLKLSLPKGAELSEVKLDGKHYDGSLQRASGPTRRPRHRGRYTVD